VIRILSRSSEAATGCLLYERPRPDGYAVVRTLSGVDYAHRLMYERFVGPIPDGAVIDHLCAVKSCCNPAHLEAVTHRVNVIRGPSPTAVAHVTDRCVAGLHDLTGANVVRLTSGRRTCRACRDERHRAWRQRRRNVTFEAP
jgi:hypothetical protein